MEGIDSYAIWRREGHMHRSRRPVLCLGDPEERLPIPPEANRNGGIAELLGDAERLQRLRIESARALQIADAEAEVVEHGSSLGTAAFVQAIHEHHRPGAVVGERVEVV